MRLLTILIFLISAMTFAQSPVEKFTDQLKHQTVNSSTDTEVLVWIIFKDKGSKSDLFLSKPETIVSKKSLERRLKVFTSKSVLEDTDLPVPSDYIEQVQSLGFKVKQKSKWFNGVSGYASVSVLNAISALPFVKQIDLVACLPKNYEKAESDFTIDVSKSIQNKIQSPNLFDYGNSSSQVQQINVHEVHNLGYTGQGVTVCVMDAGFNRLSMKFFPQ